MDVPTAGPSSGQSPSTAKANANANSEWAQVERVMFGQPGPLHSSRVSQFGTEDVYRQNLLRFDIPLEQATRMVAMFNFPHREGIVSNHLHLFSKDRVSIQLDDSDWSSNLSLDSVGVDQTVDITHYAKRERGVLEAGLHKVGLRVNSVPGRLAKYTRIVRFTPGIVFVNNLGRGLSLLQPR